MFPRSPTGNGRMAQCQRTISIPIPAPMIMEASVDPHLWGPDWMPITQKRRHRGVLFSATLPNQTEGRQRNLAQANKLSHTFAVLLDALNRHRGKGHQKVTVEHVHV